MQLLEGRIEVESKPGEGSTFTLRIPLYPVALDDDSALREQADDDSSLQSGRDEALQEAAETSHLRILLIDDDRIQLTLTAAMLSQSGITSVTCLQLDELLEALRTDTFDVLLTDVQMPAMNGFDLLKLLRASNIPQARSIPMIAVTARSDMQREEFLQHGFAGCLHKPFTVHELLGEVERGGEVENRAWSVESAVQHDSASPDTASDSPLNKALTFETLTAFSGDDPDAAKSILESFVTETRLNADRLRQALETGDTDGVAAMGHKMLPLFTLLGAGELVALLKDLEASRGVPFTEEIKQKSLGVLVLVEEAVAQAEKLYQTK